MGAHRNNVDFQRANRAERSCNQKHDCAHFSILRNGEQTPQGSSSPQLEICKFFQSPRITCITVEQVRCTQDLPKNPIRCTPQATPKRQNKLKDTRAKEKCPDFKCEQRGKAGTLKKKFFQKPPWLTGGTRAQPAPTAAPATAEEGRPGEEAPARTALAAQQPEDSHTHVDPLDHHAPSQPSSWRP